MTTVKSKNSKDYFQDVVISNEMGNHLHEWLYCTRVPYERFVEDLLSNKTLPYAKSPAC